VKVVSSNRVVSHLLIERSGTNPSGFSSPAIIVTLPVVVIVAKWETTAFLFLLVCPVMHHVAQFYHCFRTVSSKITVKGLGGDAIVEVVDDVLVEDVGDGGPCVEEAIDIGPQGLAWLLFAHYESNGE
jgi:hypothetical protein